MESLLKVEEAAEALSIGRSRMYQLVKDGEIPVVRFGKSIRIRPRDLRNFVASLPYTGPEEFRPQPDPADQ